MTEEKCKCDECLLGIDDGTPVGTPHYHKNSEGDWVKCYHECKSIVRQPSFWILTTLTFPIEHGIWGMIYKLFGWSP